MSLTRIRKQPVTHFSPWDFDREAGDRVFRRRDESAEMIDLHASNGRTGELSYRVVKKHGVPRLAVMGDDDLWYWED